MLSMMQTAKSISTYSADVFGVASALFELGGMTVIHDASGCNSTYTTHDEPRWYDMESMVFISALTEMEAIMGDDEKLFTDIERAAKELHPKFIAIAGTPIPTMNGFDYAAAEKVLEARTGIPTFGFATTGMQDYSVGVSMALEAIAKRFPVETERTEELSCNILGLTPLDFTLNGSAQSVREFLEENGYQVISSWAMDTTLEEMMQAGKATVNVVVSASGLAAARVLKQRFGTPYVCGLPIGKRESQRLLSNLQHAVKKENLEAGNYYTEDAKITIIGEPIQSQALAACIYEETGKAVRCICPPSCAPEILASFDSSAYYESDIREALAGTEILIADQLYETICPSGCRFVALPHEAFSGRMYSDVNPNLIKNYDVIVKEI